MTPEFLMKKHFSAIFISDLHLGTRATKDEFLLDFLDHHECDQLFLIGDIIDVWAMRRSFYWNDHQNKIISLILKRANKGTKVIFIPGNHDSEFRDFIGNSFGNISIHSSIVFHDSYGDKDYLVTHGDEADFLIQKHIWAAKVGSYVYDWLVALNGGINKVRKYFGLGYISIAGRLKHLVKSSSSYIGSFETAMTELLLKEGLDGVICGHIHVPLIKTIGPFEYLNAGDWVESCTAIAYDKNGFQLLTWKDKHVNKKNV